MSLARLLVLMLVPISAAAQEIVDLSDQVTYPGGTRPEIKREAERKADEPNRRAFFAYPVGKTYWYVPGSGMKASFYQTRRVDRSIGAELRDPFRPDGTVSFEIMKLVEMPGWRGLAPDFAYRIQFENGTMGYLDAADLGAYVPGAAADSERTNVTADPKASADPWNSKFFSENPAQLRQAYDIQREQAKREAERMRAEREHADEIRRAEEKTRIAAALAAQQQEAARENARRTAAARANKAKGGVRIGMTAQQALASSWGRPSSVNRTTSAYGTREQWVYGGHNYLYFENGILTSIQN